MSEIKNNKIIDASCMVKHDVHANQSHWDNTGNLCSYILTMPPVVRRRFRALKKLQAGVISLESKFFKKVHNLRCEYENHYKQLLEKRYQIVSAQVEPDDDECRFSCDEDESEAFKRAMATLRNSSNQDRPTSNVKGIPDFWLRIFKNVNILADMIEERDIPVLRHLQDIRVKLLNEEDSKGFTLEFVFEPNEFFTDTVLTKQYEMGFEPDEHDVFSYEGPEINKCTGCKINWKKGKNVTLKKVDEIKIRQWKKAKLIPRMIRDNSFFNFFNPPQVLEGEVVEDDKTWDTLKHDYEVGRLFFERIVPKAVCCLQWKRF